MAKGATYIVQYRRRRNNETNYKRRLNLLKSEKPRLVVRFSNKHAIAQVINYKPDGDLIVAHAQSSELKKFGWDFNTGNLPSAYLTGLLCGLKAFKNKEAEAVLDTGLMPPIAGSKIYAALKGAVDSGLSVAHDPKIFPPDERIRGDHIADYTNNSINENFDKVKEKIINSFK
ncbi:MAG: 50S ribosomal protein L18 [Candidatus Altiarchaeales archaeon HGW-Altiarchaeales-3]|nr:MAG: 50S ribosomal protein L18 [Candidatus Altiarchaeales archaeon HGW-Altiarchaeales-3]